MAHLDHREAPADGQLKTESMALMRGVLSNENSIWLVGSAECASSCFYHGAQSCAEWFSPFWIWKSAPGFAVADQKTAAGGLSWAGSV